VVFAGTTLCFLYEVVPMHGSYNPLLVALSLLVAMLASYTTLDLAARIRALEATGLRRLRWLLGGAAAMGTGIWSMHFIGMLALRMPMEMGYDVRITGLSFLIAVLISGFALQVVTSRELGRRRLILGGVLMGLGIAAMHYTGMAAMRMHPALRYAPWLFLASLAVAITASWAALWIAFTLRDSSQHHVLMKRFGAGVLMGLAIAGMHYTGMSAAVFPAGAVCRTANSVTGSSLAFVIGAASLFILALSLIVSVLDTRLDERTSLMNESLERVNKQLLSLATEDTLTGIPNRNAFMEHAASAIDRCRRSDRPFTVMFMDLDGFKTINDSLGHSSGDKLLKAFSHHLIRSVRRDDVVARLGGDEFVILLEGIGEQAEVGPIARGVQLRMQEDFYIDGVPLRVTASIGIARYPRDGETVETLLQGADMAMYEAKQKGRNTYRFFEATMSEAAARTLQIYRDLGLALERGEISLVFQPKFGMERELVGAEALIRWRHPRMGDIPPLDFISIAEKTGQIMQISDWTIREVCRQLKLWDEAGLSPVKIAINLSPEQLRQPEFVEHVRRILSDSDVEPERMMFEITETMAMQDAEMVAGVIHRFQDAGFDIAIDDFGTGYSSMAYLQQFRVKQLKIDRFFTSGLDSNGLEGQTIVSKIIELAHSLGMVVVAEGVETNSQFNKLKELQCDEIQGYLLARPLTPGDFEEFVQGRTKLLPNRSGVATTKTRLPGSLQSERLLA
jgi:diguanylate cyclase (GGDEF)-like protein